MDTDVSPAFQAAIAAIMEASQDSDKMDKSTPKRPTPAAHPNKVAKRKRAVKAPREFVPQSRLSKRLAARAKKVGAMPQ